MGVSKAPHWEDARDSRGTSPYTPHFSMNQFYGRGTLIRLGPPVVPFYPFWGEGSPTKIDYRKKWDPYSNLSTGGPGRAKQVS